MGNQRAPTEVKHAHPIVVSMGDGLRWELMGGAGRRDDEAIDQSKWAGTHVRTYAGTQVRTYAHTHIRTYAGTHVRTYAGTHVRTYARTHIRRYARTHIRTYAHTQVRRYARTHIRRYVLDGSILGSHRTHRFDAIAAAVCIRMQFQNLSRERYSNINKEVSSELDGGLPSR